jgi:hypothetical protein
MESKRAKEKSVFLLLLALSLDLVPTHLPGLTMHLPLALMHLPHAVLIPQAQTPTPSMVLLWAVPMLPTTSTRTSERVKQRFPA